jgi:hypothetical protein
MMQIPRQQMLRERRGPYEEPDPTPVELPAGHMKPLSLKQEMMRFVKSELLAEAARNEGFGSFEDEDDFEHQGS